MNKHFLILIGNCDSCDQRAMLSRSACKRLASIILLTVAYSVTSSAYKINLLNLQTLVRSLINKINNIGPRTDPSGMPLVQGREEDRISELPIFTCCVLPVKSDLIHLVTNKGSPYEFNLCNNLLWEIESNAFLKSINIQSILSLFYLVPMSNQK